MHIILYYYSSVLQIAIFENVNIVFIFGIKSPRINASTSSVHLPYNTFCLFLHLLVLHNLWLKRI